jgi:hypothetical protein
MAKGDWTIWVMIIVGVAALALVVGLVIYGVRKLSEADNTFLHTPLVDSGR